MRRYFYVLVAHHEREYPYNHEQRDRGQLAGVFSTQEIATAAGERLWRETGKYEGPFSFTVSKLRLDSTTDVAGLVFDHAMGD